MSALMVNVPRAEVLLFETRHYNKRKEERKFDSSILGKVVPRLCNLRIGQVAKYSDGAVSVICKRISATGAVLITGYKVGQKLTPYEERSAKKISMIDGWR